MFRGSKRIVFMAVLLAIGIAETVIGQEVSESSLGMDPLVGGWDLSVMSQGSIYNRVEMDDASCYLDVYDSYFILSLGEDLYYGAWVDQPDLQREEQEESENTYSYYTLGTVQDPDNPVPVVLSVDEEGKKTLSFEMYGYQLLYHPHGEGRFDFHPLPEKNGESLDETEPEGILVGSGIGQEEDSSYGATGNGADTATAGERSALSRAREYLAYTSFSYTGLIDQLDYEGFSPSECVYAADHCGADWNEQARKKAKEYLAYTSFSYKGLIEQLEYEGFTYDQALQAADHCGADWYAQAAKKAKEYRNYMSMSRADLENQLEFEGFTPDQASYGASHG